MVIDTSALIAIALGEPSRDSLLDAIELAPKRIISSVSLLEAGMVLRARGWAKLPFRCYTSWSKAWRGKLWRLMKLRQDWRCEPLGVLGRGWATKRS